VTPILEARRVSKRFGGVQALDAVDLTAHAGEVHGLIGPNGAGKSTLISCMAGVNAIDGGEVSLHGRRIDGLPVHRRARLGIARTFQKIRLAQPLTVFENVATGLMARGGADRKIWSRLGAAMSAATVVEPVRRALEATGIADLAGDTVASLPFGKRHFVELARALASDPAVVLLDEPATGLTDAERQRLTTLVRHLAARGCSIIIVEHDLALVGALCDRVTVLDTGRRIFLGTPAEAQENDDVVKAYLGSVTFTSKGPRRND